MVRIAVKAWSMTVKFPAKISPLTRMSQVLGFWFLVEKRPTISPEQGSKGSRGYYANGRNMNRNVRIECQNALIQVS